MKTFKDHLSEAQKKEKEPKEKVRPEFESGGLYAKGNKKRDAALKAKLQIGQKAYYKGRMVALHTPFIQRSGNSKYAVYLNSGRKNKDGDIIAKILRFGDANSTVKNHDDARRYSFLKRHKCSLDMDINKASFWSCWIHVFHKELDLASNNPW